MNLFDYIRNIYLFIKKHLKSNSLDSLLWHVDIMPYVAGFSIRQDTVWLPFWIIHLILLFYVYGVSIFVYVWKHVHGAKDMIEAYVNLSLLILICNVSWWSLKKRALLKAVLKDIALNDQWSRQSTYFQAKHDKLMQKVKWIIMIFAISNNIDALFIDIPHRAANMNYMEQCVGLEPLTASPNREICLTILIVQELLAVIVVINYQALLLLLIAHTTVMYQMLTHEMMFLDEHGNVPHIKELAKEILPSLIKRHSLTLTTIEKLKALYAGPLGVSFGSNAVCMVLFFSLPIQEWLKLVGIAVYCFVVFFLYCFLCQRLINASEDFERCIYCCGWENFDLRETKLVFMMLRQAQKPIQILAADIIPVNIYTFATTLQGMFKFVTVVKI